MSDRIPVARSGQYKPRMTGASSVQMEDRDVMRRMERERRSQEVQQEEMQYDRIAPLFSEPFKRIKGDELSSLIQRMLGNYEDGSDDLCSGVDRSEASLAAPASASGPVPPPGERWDSLPALRPPAEPLSPLQSSDSDGGASPERGSRRLDVPPLTLTLPLNLHCKPANVKKPTAYVRPMDGQDHVTSDSPQLKASPEHLQDLKESSKPNLPPLQSVDVVSGGRVEDILQEMTSWPPLLTAICTPSRAEPPKFVSTNEESHGFTALTHESSDGVQLEPQGGSSSSSDSDSSSDTDSENNNSPDQPAAHEPSHTQTQKGSDWQLGRWLESKENQHQQSPGSPYDVIKPNSHDSAGRTEAAGQQGCYSNPTDSGKTSDHRQTVGNTSTCESLLLGSTCVEISQRDENTTTRRLKHKKTTRDTEQKRTTTDNKQTDGKQTRQPLLVKIQLNLLSRIPREPKAVRRRTSLTSGRKRAAERDEKSPKKKQKLEKKGKQSFSSQHSLHRSEAGRNSDSTTMKRRKSVKHSSGFLQDASGHKRPSAAAPDSQPRTAEAHGKQKSCKSRNVLPEKTCPPAAEARALLPPDRRQRSVEDHLKEAKKLKHKADATPDKTAKALSYLEAALAFVESAVAMETEPQTPKSAYTMLSETLDLIRFILKLKNYTDPSAVAHERDFFILCLRCQSLLQMAMFRYRRDSALRYSRTLADHFRSSSWSASPAVSRSSSAAAGSSLVIPQPVQQAAASYVSITALFLSAHETWEQADDLTDSGSGLLRELDSAVGPLSLTASMSSLVTYVRHGLHWIRRDTQNSL
ncbi:AF4/FMR2 family member 3 isoform X3 [Ctenopharyngodon idella]|uniref:AF4/FMR2 family member 3 isoform X3 n=1 Tax=Ctenopharyngodon idella TaxID=7959 RepID=UPI00222E8208|nr:AF4/FMR2 family member 3 isoform X3 [Ctenopharyngodon idella]